MSERSGPQIGRRLEKPPVVEAVCEFRLRDDATWDWTIPGRLFAHVGAEFSERAEFQDIGIKVERAGRVSTGGPTRIQLKRPDGSAMVQIAPRTLGVIQLPPYPDCETFRALIARVYRAYEATAAITPLSRVGLRYINRIPANEHDVPHMLSVWPSFQPALRKAIANFYQRYQFNYFNPDGILTHQTGTVVQEEKRHIMLDLDFYSTRVSHLSELDSVLEWLQAAHDRVEKSFIDSLDRDFYTKLLGGENT